MLESAPTDMAAKMYTFKEEDDLLKLVRVPPLQTPLDGMEKLI
jgi:hypothetical protein